MLPNYELLYNLDLIKNGKVNPPAIRNLTKKKMLDVAKEFIEISKTNDVVRETSIFSQSASHSLGGGVDECRGLRCRLKKIDNLSRYAILYTNKVFIDNLFIRYRHYENSSKSDIFEEFYNDLIILSYIQPLVEKGIINIFTPNSDVCPHCLSYVDDDKLIDNTTSDQISNIRDSLHSRYLKETTATLISDHGMLILRLNGPQDLIHNGQVFFYTDKSFIQKLLRDFPYLDEEVNRNGEALLTKEVQKICGFHEKFTDTFLRDFSFQIITSNIIGTSFLSDNPSTISYLQSMTDNVEIEQRNLISEKYLTTIIPFINDVPLSEMIKLRERELDSIFRFRSALNKAIGEYSQRNNQFNILIAKQLYSDIIEPDLIKMERSLENAKRDLIKITGLKILGTTAALAFGIYSGLLTENLLEVAKTLGLFGLVSEITQKAVSLNNIDKVIRNENYFFLLKLKQSS
jgi:hypothetical protein